MDPAWKGAIWRQIGAAIDELEGAVKACPDNSWRAPLWDNVDRPHFFLPEFWYVVYHTLFWLDLYLTGAEEGFAPPPPFMLVEQNDEGPLPERPYSKDELQSYLRDCRARCRATIEGLTEEGAQRRCRFSWGEVSFGELLLYNMRHVQEHAAQLNLMLGQHGGATTDWVASARREVG